MRAPLPLADRLATMLGRLAPQFAIAVPAPRASVSATPQAPAVESSPAAAALFAEALRANSNLELDWLWLATRLVGVEERRYCFLKALAINPASPPAREGLRALAAAHP